MRQFVYEIDERNLRVKLKDLEQPLKEGAWERFEEFSGKHNKRHAEENFKFKFSLNRNAVLLGVFATVIISFSLLLFNFISIKNPKSSAWVEGAKTPTSAPAPETPKPAESVKTTPAVKAPAVTNTVAAQPAAVVKEEKPKQGPEAVVEAVVATPKPQVKEEKPVKVEKTPEELAKKAEEDAKGAEEDAKGAEEFERRRQKREAAALAKKIKPEAVTEDTEPDVRPQ